MKPGVSIIIPTYNREHLIIQAVESVINQDFAGNMEIIISDDGSTDNTLINLENYSSKIKVLKKPNNCKKQGAAVARNRGIKTASQNYICFLDSDDFYLPGHLTRMVETLENNPEDGFAFCRVLQSRSFNSSYLYKPWTYTKVLKNDIKNIAISRSHIVHTNSFIFRRKVFDTIGGFNENYSNGEDSDMWIRIGEKFKGQFVDNFGCVYRTNHESCQLTKNDEKEIHSLSKLILKNAEKRYYDLNIHDNRRIFKIKYNLLQLNKKGVNFNKYYHYIRYLWLILRYPNGFVQLLSEIYYENRETTKWRTLDEYIDSCSKFLLK